MSSADDCVSRHRGRPLRARIDVRAFQRNIERAHALAKQAEVVVVIKADGYGHGLLAIARAAGDHDLAVATPEEARCLINAGIQNRIWVMEGPFSKDCLGLAERSEIVWVLHSQWQLDLIQSCSFSTPLQVWIKVDTGMHRLGFVPEEVSTILAQVATSPIVDVIGLMTHFASSDLPATTDLESPLMRLGALVRAADGSLACSAANSGAVLYYPESHFDWVRPGIMLYGAMPNPTQSASEVGLTPVMTFESAVMAIKIVRAGESVGYGATWTAAQDSTIAVVACGYGDGYPRHAPNGTPVWVAGQRVPLVGRVSMDMLTVDVSSIDEVNVGDPVELWGQQLPIDEVALSAGTIAYALLTGVTQRVPRIYAR